MTTLHSPARSLRDCFAQARSELSRFLIERDREIDLALTALIAREHLLLVGPPGTAKSLLLDSIAQWIDGTRFTALLTKFSQMEELYGPLSLPELKKGRYVRVTAGMLPEAQVAFLDEIFKSSSAILNTLLRLLNERVFDIGGGEICPVPLMLCVAASNEWAQPTDGARELDALFDRFCLRAEVRPIATAEGRKRLLWEPSHKSELSSKITPAEVDHAHTEAMALPWSEDARDALEQVIRELAREGITPGDRRQFKSVRIVKAYAYLDGAEQVEPDHLEVLQHVLWNDPHEQPRKVADVIAKVANPSGMKINALLLEAEQILAETVPTDLSQAARATAKLQEIERTLAGLKSDPRVEKSRNYVRDQIKKLKLASIEAI